MKTTERNLADILLSILLLITIGFCVRSCSKCNESLERLEKLRQHEVVNFIK